MSLVVPLSRSFPTLMQNLPLPQPLPSTMMVAVSGGPDSMALAVLTGEWARETVTSLFIHLLSTQLQNKRFLAVTIDHGLRVESKGEAQMVHEELTRRGFEHRIVTLDWPHGLPGSAVNEVCRQRRYDALAKLGQDEGGGVVLVAHHGDDLVEGFVLNMAHLSGLFGLASLAPARRINSTLYLARPLLSLSKVDLVSFCRDKSIPYVNDPTNFKLHSHAQRARYHLIIVITPLPQHSACIATA